LKIAETVLLKNLHGQPQL